MHALSGIHAATTRHRETGRGPEPGTDPIDAWLSRHQTRPWRYLRTCGCPPDLADDLLQDALLAALHKRIPELDDGDGARWLIGAVRNLWREHLRQQAALGEVLRADDDRTAVAAGGGRGADEQPGEGEPRDASRGRGQ